jgi:hypothetical protein
MFFYKSINLICNSLKKDHGVSKLLRDCLSVLPGKGIKGVFSFQTSQRVTKHCREQNVACELGFEHPVISTLVFSSVDGLNNDVWK